MRPKPLMPTRVAMVLSPPCPKTGASTLASSPWTPPLLGPPIGRNSGRGSDGATARRPSGRGAARALARGGGGAVVGGRGRLLDGHGAARASVLGDRARGARAEPR